MLPSRLPTLSQISLLKHTLISDTEGTGPGPTVKVGQKAIAGQGHKGYISLASEPAGDVYSQPAARSAATAQGRGRWRWPRAPGNPPRDPVYSARPLPAKDGPRGTAAPGRGCSGPSGLGAGSRGWGGPSARPRKGPPALPAFPPAPRPPRPRSPRPTNLMAEVT